MNYKNDSDILLELYKMVLSRLQQAELSNAEDVIQDMYL